MNELELNKKLISYKDAVKNYERGIKRLRKQVWRDRNQKDRINELERIVVKYYCGKNLHRCATTCQTSEIHLHSEGRAILARQNVISAILDKVGL